MSRKLLALALLFGLGAAASGDLITVPLDFVPATSTINKLDMTLHASYSGFGSASDNSSTTVLNGSEVLLKLDYSFHPTSRQVTSVNSIEFTGGNFALADTPFDLDFVIVIIVPIHYHMYVNANDVAGTFDTPSPPGGISGGSTATFPTGEHELIIDEGTIEGDSFFYDTSFAFGNPAVRTTTEGIGTITTTLNSLVGNLATYGVEMILPIDFNEPIPTDDENLTASLEGTGTFKATGSFSVVTPIPGDTNGDRKVDSVDAAVVAQHWGGSSTGPATGDFTGDGVVGPADAAIQMANWGDHTAESAAVPEPSVLGLLACGLLAVAIRRRRA